MRSALELGPEIRVIGARAHRGEGVRETAGLAVRAAAERVRAIVSSNGFDAMNDTAANAFELAEQMRQNERVETFDRVSQVVNGSFTGELPLADAPRPPRVRAPVPGLPALPAQDSPSGLIWPAEEGRSILRRALEALPELESHKLRTPIALRCGRLVLVGRPVVALRITGDWTTGLVAGGSQERSLGSPSVSSNGALLGLRR